MLDQDVIDRLKKPLDHTRIKTRQGGGGRDLAYLKGHNIIDVANETFGFGQWGYDLLNVELVNVVGEDGQIVGGYYAARVRLNVTGCVPITEEGINPIQEGRNPRARIDAHDMARKGAVTDAMKRAFRCFGDQFGNSLYDNEPGRDGDTSKTPPAQAASQPTQRTNNTAQPAQRPAAAPQQQQQARPVTQPAPAKPIQAPSINGEKATEPQINAILKMSGKKGMDEIELAQRLKELYGSGLDGLTKNDAGHFIKVLQE